MSITRRQFMVGCSTAIAALAGGRIGQLVFANEPSQTPKFTTYLPSAMVPGQTLIMVFLRGGMDGLSVVSPYDDPTYVQKRKDLALKSPININPNNGAFGATSSFGLHPSAAPLKELYDAGKLAIVHGCGLDDDTRSHFDAMDYIERGTPGNKNTATGWISRYIELRGGYDGLLPIVASGSAAPSSLLGESDTAVIGDLNSYGLSGPWRYNNASNPAMLNVMRQLYSGNASLVGEGGKRALEVMDAIQNLKAQNDGKDLDYTPTQGVEYPGGLGNALKQIAQIIKLNLGLQVATVDFGGWDTHDEQGTNNGYFANQVNTLSRALHAFYNDLPNHRNQVTIAVMSEFGRRLGTNAGNGTDHGHGNCMFVLGGNVNGGKLYGQWPGLLDLDQSQDLRITTDYRSVLGEIMAQRFGGAQLGKIFPGLNANIYRRLGILPGADAAVNFTV